VKGLVLLLLVLKSRNWRDLQHLHNSGITTTFEPIYVLIASGVLSVGEVAIGSREYNEEEVNTGKERHR
jgi:hypothetical protein